jgi:hypothetical protein
MKVAEWTGATIRWQGIPRSNQTAQTHEPMDTELVAFSCVPAGWHPSLRIILRPGGRNACRSDRWRRGPMHRSAEMRFL